MIRKSGVNKSSKSIEAPNHLEDGCSRVGENFQVRIPEFGTVTHYDAVPEAHKEFPVWFCNKQPTNEEIKSYLDVARGYKYNQELALVLLHWHNYDLKRAVDDLPNYVPASNKWTKSEVRKFLKCIDSKPRKNFTEAKKAVPGRHMGDICALYYSIAAPFKAQTRTKYHNELIDQCFTRAVRTGLVTSRWRRSLSPSVNPMSISNSNNLRLGFAEDPLEREIELHLVNLVGVSTATQLLSKKLICTPYPLLNRQVNNDPNKHNDTCAQPLINTTVNHNSSIPNGCNPSTFSPVVSAGNNHITNYQTSSSDCSSQIDGESSNYRVCLNRHLLPSGIHYEHDEFLAFVNTSSDQLILEEEAELADLKRNKAELYERLRATESRARSLLNKIDLLKPAQGFPQISYRWTKIEIALVLATMAKYGDDFAAIANTIGTKSESFIRDFYNHFRERFDLDKIMIISGKACNDEPVVIDTTDTKVDKIDTDSSLNHSKMMVELEAIDCSGFDEIEKPAESNNNSLSDSKLNRSFKPEDTDTESLRDDGVEKLPNQRTDKQRRKEVTRHSRTTRVMLRRRTVTANSSSSTEVSPRHARKRNKLIPDAQNESLKLLGSQPTATRSRGRGRRRR